MCTGFDEAGAQFGPYDLSFIPIGAYCPRWMMQANHIDPDEAVSIHQSLRSKQSIGMHWGTFVLTDENIFEPAEKLAQSVADRGLNPEEFVRTFHGKTSVVKVGVSGVKPRADL